MPLEKHSVFVPAPTRSSPLWRYMNLPKFLSMLQKKVLYFYNLELMARKDPFEGTLPSSRFQHRQWRTVDDMPADARGRLHGVTDLSRGFDNFKNLAEQSIRQAYAYRRSFFINCWHLSEFESSAMWNIYSRRDEGIAIVSSEERLDAALAWSPYNVFGGRVQYEDYSRDDFVMDEGNVFTPVLYKRLSFSYENEYRLVYWDTSVTHKLIEAQGGFYNLKGQLIPNFSSSGKTVVGRELGEIEKMEPRPGHKLYCDINKLIEKICISPLAESWFVDVVIAACKTYGLQTPISRSELLASPLR